MIVMRRIAICGTIALALMGQAQAQTPARSIGPWTITDSDQSCSMGARNRDQTTIWFSVQKSDPDKAELRLANANWQGLRAKPRVKIDVMINGQSQMLKPVQTFAADAESGIVVPFGKGYLRQVFAQAATIYVSYESTKLLLLYLNDDNTQLAFQAVRQCAGDHHDPFAR